MLENKTILIGITGGIAAYKICTLVRLYKKAGANVRVIMTPSALLIFLTIPLNIISFISPPYFILTHILPFTGTVFHFS